MLNLKQFRDRAKGTADLLNYASPDRRWARACARMARCSRGFLLPRPRYRLGHPVRA